VIPSPPFLDDELGKNPCFIFGVNMVYHSRNENTEMCEKLKSYYIL
jgi:hypothetical protein